MKVKKKDSVLMIWRGLALPKCHDPNEREAENDCRWIGGGTSVVTYLQRNLTCKEMIFQIKSLRHPLPIPNLWKVQWGARLTAHLLTNKQKTKFTFRSFDFGLWIASDATNEIGDNSKHFLLPESSSSRVLCNSCRNIRKRLIRPLKLFNNSFDDLDSNGHQRAT